MEEIINERQKKKNKLRKKMEEVKKKNQTNNKSRIKKELIKGSKTEWNTWERMNKKEKLNKYKWKKTTMN